MKNTVFRKILAIAAATLSAVGAAATEPIDAEAEVMLNTSTGDFAPYYLTNNKYGTLYAKDGAIAGIGLRRDEDRSERFSWTYGVNAFAGVHNATAYDRWNAETQQMERHDVRPPAVWIQELWGGVKWRAITLEAGMRQRGSTLLSDSLSSGDLMHSPTARPIPQMRAAFVDYQDIPLTGGWAQIDVSLAYGAFVQNRYLDRTFNFYDGHFVDNQLYCYRDLWLRSKPSEPLVVTIGMQMATLFGGKYRRYYKGNLVAEQNNSTSLKTFWKVLFPIENNGGNFYEGQHIGTWNFRADYHLRSGHTLSAYFQWLWEDGSGMRKGNGLDGLWGLQWTAPRNFPINGAVFEYLDLTHQSGPIHWAPQFHGGDITSQCTGSDDYYNNSMLNAYANNGLALGSPLVMSPIYNLNGYLMFRHSRTRAYHFALRGNVGSNLDWTLKIGHRKGLGSYYVPVDRVYKSTMSAAELVYRVEKCRGLKLNLAIAFDSGDLPSSSFGIMLGASYNFKLLK